MSSSWQKNLRSYLPWFWDIDGSWVGVTIPGVERGAALPARTHVGVRRARQRDTRRCGRDGWGGRWHWRRCGRRDENEFGVPKYQYDWSLGSEIFYKSVCLYVYLYICHKERVLHYQAWRFIMLFIIKMWFSSLIFSLIGKKVSIANSNISFK